MKSSFGFFTSLNSGTVCLSIHKQQDCFTKSLLTSVRCDIITHLQAPAGSSPRYASDFGMSGCRPDSQDNLPDQIAELCPAPVILTVALFRLTPILNPDLANF